MLEQGIKKIQPFTAKTAVISPNFLVWKLGEMTVFFAVVETHCESQENYLADFGKIFMGPH